MDDSTPDLPQETKIDIHSELTKNSTVHTNLKQEVIVITVDRTKLILQEHLKKLDSAKGWLTPLAIFISLIVIPITSTFKNALTVPAETWQAIWYIAMGLDIIWLVKAMITAFKDRKITMEHIIKKLKDSSIK